MTDKEYEHSRKKNLPKHAITKISCNIPEVGRTCPACCQGILEYNGLLNLVCPHCGREWSSSFT